MTKTEAPGKSDVEDASAKLSESLKTCRTLLESYRGVLAGSESSSDEPPPDPAPEPKDNE